MNEVDCLIDAAREFDDLRRKAGEAREKVFFLPRFLLKEVYQACIRFSEERWKGVVTVWERKKILFILLALLSPMTLMGERLRPGMRDRIARIMKSSPSGISRDSRKILFYYTHYPDFKTDVTDGYEYVRNSVSFEKKHKNIL